MMNNLYVDEHEMRQAPVNKIKIVYTFHFNEQEALRIIQYQEFDPDRVRFDQSRSIREKNTHEQVIVGCFS